MTDTMNLPAAQFNMIHQQLRPWQVLDAEVLDLLAIVKRQDFVPAAYRGLAYADTEIPLGHGAAMLSPKIEARALQALGLRKHERILEIGAGSGYMAALLANHADHVWTVDIEPALADLARANLQRAGIYNVTVEAGNGALGWPAQAPYDAIMVSAGLSRVPAELLAQLKVGGRLFAVVGEWPAMTAQLLTRVAENSFPVRGLFETLAESLRDAPAKPGFDF